MRLSLLTDLFLVTPLVIDESLQCYDRSDLSDLEHERASMLVHVIDHKWSVRLAKSMLLSRDIVQLRKKDLMDEFVSEQIRSFGTFYHRHLIRWHANLLQSKQNWEKYILNGSRDFFLLRSSLEAQRWKRSRVWGKKRMFEWLTDFVLLFFNEWKCLWESIERRVG